MTVIDPNESESLIPLRVTGYDDNAITPLTESNRVSVKLHLSRVPTSYEVAASDDNKVTEINTDKVNLNADWDHIYLYDVEINKLGDWVQAANACLSMYESEGHRAARLDEQLRAAARRTLSQIDFEKL